MFIATTPSPCWPPLGPLAGADRERSREHGVACAAGCLWVDHALEPSGALDPLGWEMWRWVVSELFGCCIYEVMR